MRRWHVHCPSFHLGDVVWHLAKRTNKGWLFFSLIFVLQEMNDDN